jgi:Na+-translocating ferredoxin:NAD+ oxidoreductase RNF subunit RnfB
LINIGLLSAEDKDRNVAILEVKAVDARKTLGGNGITIFKCDHERATEIGDYMHVFYEEIRSGCRLCLTTTAMKTSEWII